MIEAFSMNAESEVDIEDNEWEEATNGSSDRC